MKNRCYLCGREGADTKDHVPPKAFLNRGNFQGVSRITLPAHQGCNAAYSADEEYVRDLLAPSAQELDLRGVDDVLGRYDRSVSRPAGASRRGEFLRHAKIMQKRSSSGLFTGPALGLPFDRQRVDRVGAKIARGILFHDAQVVVAESEVLCYGIPVNQIESERRQELEKGNPYWVRLGWNTCKHDMYGESVAVRRHYLGQPTQPQIMIECVMAVMVLAQFFIVGCNFTQSSIGREDFSFAIDTSTGAWIRD